MEAFPFAPQKSLTFALVTVHELGKSAKKYVWEYFFSFQRTGGIHNITLRLIKSGKTLGT